MLTPHHYGKMMDRQSGSAGTINIYFFLIVLALFMGSVAYAYHLFTQNESMESEIKQLAVQQRTLEGRHLLQKDYLEELSAAIGVTGEYAGRPGVSAARYGATITSTVDPALLKSRKQAFATEMNVPNLDGLEGLFAALTGSAQAMQNQVAAAKNAESVANSMRGSAEAALARVNATFRDEQGVFSDVVSADTTRFSTINAERQTAIGRLQTRIQEVAGELAKANEARLEEVRTLTEVANRLIGHNTSAVEKLRLRESYDGPDGQVTADLSGVDTVVINLGRKDNLVPGVVFRFREPNNDAVKGYGTVTSVDQETARVKVHDLTDPRNPVVRGDKLFHDLYTPNVRRNVYLMGRFGYPYDRDRIEAQLRALGNRVAETFEPGVDLVLVGQEVLNAEGNGFMAVESTDEYSKALSLGVEFVDLKDVRDLLRFH